ncbi:MAG TPA: hypothetical protein VHC19_18425 [Pirellulales bacterium]|nr:hypothetical protein [Pirellulales bacterium]
MPDGEYQYLPVQCPRCGLEGKVKISRLDRTFTCKQCKKVFHVTLDGTVSGERPPQAVDADPADMIAEETQSRFERWVAALPRAWQIVLGGICLLALGFGIKALTEPEVPIPGELEARAKFAATALARGEWRQVKRLAFPGTVKDLGRWYDAVRPKGWAEATSESRVKVELGAVSKQLRGYEKNEPILDCVVPVTVEVPGKGKLEKAPFYFSQDEELEWWLNGEMMLKNAKPEKAAKKAK